ncbi:hypothetical protein [Methylobacterium trifolii]|uniref:Uncharacterized protein n=1 Tax=Methylobacterium trifolii TaxID=1003092 RepID=A0ABQ4U2P2_9HYPH|nr:hypothetical protein [Methylobacterium trifolii]GJE61753.1 hypothetical protein MPOCJGCO_3878 [Methylobacterium trifolii]
MSNDTEKHHALISGLKTAMGKTDDSFEQAVTSAFEHVFQHLDRLNSHVSLGGADGEDRPLRPGETSTLR